MNGDELTPHAEQAGPNGTGESDPLVRAILRAGQRDRAPRGSEARMLAVLGVGGGMLGGGLVAATLRVAARLGAKGLVATALVSGAAVGIGAWVYASSAPSGIAATPAVVTSTPAISMTASTAPTPSTPVTTTTTPETLPTTRVEDLPKASASGAVGDSAKASAANAANAKPVDPEASLAREVALVEAARSALARGDAGAALRSLDAHDREMPSGALMPEARVLRIEALVKAGGEGNTARANALGDAFLAASPGGAQARRVKTVLGRAP